MIKHKIIQLNSITSKNNDVVLHENTLDVLFKNKEEIYKKLINLRGIFLIDHIAIKVIDPENKICIFSITPSVEYNLIIQELWRFDHSFSKNFQNKNTFYTWEEAYEKEYFQEIKLIKELKHGFTYGFCLSKKVGNFTLIYSFGTRSKNINLHNYYYAHTNELNKLGDYGYKLIHDIYQKYCDKKSQAPLISNKNYSFIKPFLRLIK